MSDDELANALWVYRLRELHFLIIVQIIVIVVFHFFLSAKLELINGELKIHNELMGLQLEEQCGAEGIRK